MFVAHIRLEFNYKPDSTDVYDYLQQLINDGGIEYNLTPPEDHDPLDVITSRMYHEDIED
tara:strand:- start:296 stop:475 length:180 start_codon:yes stop_codon:yes gene_type:complete